MRKLVDCIYNDQHTEECWWNWITRKDKWFFLNLNSSNLATILLLFFDKRYHLIKCNNNNKKTVITFRSRCTIAFEWTYSIACTIWRMKIEHALSVRMKSSQITRSNSSPPSTLWERWVIWSEENRSVWESCKEMGRKGWKISHNIMKYVCAMSQ